jgi:hypothetical protein
VQPQAAGNGRTHQAGREEQGAERLGEVSKLPQRDEQQGVSECRRGLMELPPPEGTVG